MSRKFALIIGNSEYTDKNLACLKTPSADVGALAEVLLDSTRGGFDEVQTLINESDSTIRKAIERFFARKKSDDLLLLYFSGHGVMDDQGRLYLAAQDTEYELWSASAIPATFITDNMDRSQSRRQVLILDCCHSGAFFRGTKAVTGVKAVTEMTFEGKGYGRVVLTATDTTQYAWSEDQVIGETENSVFTHFLIEGLKTGAADTNNDGHITVDELYDYVYRNLVSATSRQTPCRWVYNQQGGLIIAANPSPIIKPEPLPDELLQAIEHTSPFVREGAVRELERLLGGRNKGRALSAREALERLAADDDSRKVSTFASEILERCAEVAAPAPDLQSETVEQDNVKAASELAEKEKEHADKEKEAERKRTKISNLDQEAQAAEDKEDWTTVIEKRQALLALEPAHSESILKLGYAQTQQKLVDLYAQGQKFNAAHEWSQALSCFEQVQDLKVDYKDVINLIEDIQRKIAEEAKPEPLPLTMLAPAELTTPASPDSLELTHLPTPEPSREPHSRRWFTRTSVIIFALFLVLSVTGLVTVYLSWTPVTVQDNGAKSEEDSTTRNTASSTATKWVPNGEERSISGVVAFTGTPPVPRRIDTSADQVCSMKNPNLTTEDAVIKDGKVANVFVYIKAGTLANGRKIDDYDFDPAPQSVTVDQHGCQFRPHVLGIQTNQKLLITNSDATQHNVHATPKLNLEWNQSQPNGSPAIEKSFPHAETLIPVKCNQHPWMKAYIGVLKHPFFGVSGDDGTYTIKNVPAGTYTIVAWREGYPNVEQERQVIVTAGKNAKANFSFGDTATFSAPGSLQVMPALQIPMVGVKQ